MIDTKWVKFKKITQLQKMRYIGNTPDLAKLLKLEDYKPNKASHQHGKNNKRR
jgi:hypothetical protein